MKKIKLFSLMLPILFALFAVFANAQITSVSQIKDVKPSDKHYQALKSLVEHYGVISDNPFRANDPLTREDFVVLLNSGLDQLMETAMTQSDDDVSASDFFNPFSANGANITSMSQIKDIEADYGEYEHLQSLTERYGIDICDKDKNFRPTKTVTEKEFYTWIAKIFNGSLNSNPSATKAITRSEWAIVMNAAFDSVSKRIEDIAAEKKAKLRDAKDVKPADKYYKPLQILFDKYELKLLDENSLFHADEPVSGSFFAYVIGKGLNKLDSSANLLNAKITDYYTPYSFIKKAKSDGFNYNGYDEVKILNEKYHIDICDANNLFQPKKIITEKEFYDFIAAVFKGNFSGNPSATKPLTRGEFVTGMTSVFENWDSYFTKEYATKRINDLPSLGKAQIIDATNIYPMEEDIREPKSKCIDYKNASRDLWQVLKFYKIGGNYTPKIGDTGDIVFESTDTCKKGEKVVMMRIGTAFVTIAEKGIKRLK